MSSKKDQLNSLFSIEDLSPAQVQKLMASAMIYKNKAKNKAKNTVKNTAEIKQPKNLVAALVFFEPSTRTRFSFEVAAHRLNVSPISFIADGSTSISKGESLHETLANLIAMEPDLLVVRHAGDVRVDQLLLQSDIPVINAGNGTQEHPTQALLDALTIFENHKKMNKKFEDEKIVYIGDVEHSRVARSGIQLFLKMGAQVAVCSPEGASWNGLPAGVKRFENLSEALPWCSVCIGLRIQRERHEGRFAITEQAYVDRYRLDKKSIVHLPSSAIIMHPGPFVPDVDLTEDILTDERSVIHTQVTNGIYMRMAVMGELLGISNT